MRRQSDSEHVAARAVLRTVAGEYETAQTRVHAAYRKMRTVMHPSYAPADVRAAATELAEALRDATAIAVEYLRTLQEEAPRQRRGRRRRLVRRTAAADSDQCLASARHARPTGGTHPDDGQIQ